MQYFCTYFDRNYLVRGLALYSSLKKVGATFTLWALCLDDESFQVLAELAWPGLVPVALSDLEAFDPELAAVKPWRTVIEYYFTLTPSLPLYLLDRHPEVDVISYLDADLKFYQNPERVLSVLGSDSILIIPHGFPEHLRSLESFGKYNVGMVSFRNDESGTHCLRRWRSQCIEWCYDRVEDGRFADQAYLDDWPETQRGVVVLDRPGVGLAPWNFMRFRIDTSSEPPTVDGQPLVFYHFHAFKSVGPRLFNDGLIHFGTMSRDVRMSLYGGYIRDLLEAMKTIEGRGTVVAGSRRKPRPPWRHIFGLARRRRLLLAVRDVVIG